MNTSYENRKLKVATVSDIFLPSDTKSVEQYKQLVNQQHVSPVLSINV